MALGFTSIRDLVLERASRREICDRYAAIEATTTWTEFLSTGCGFFAWAYQNDLITDGEILEIPSATAALYGIYFLDTTLTNPDVIDYDGCHNPNIELETAFPEPQEIYLVTIPVINLTLSGGANCTVYAMGGTVVNITMTGGSKCLLRAFNTAVCNVTASGGSVVCFELKDESQATIILNDSSVSHGEQRGHSALSFTGHNTSFVKLSMWMHSTATLTLLDTAQKEVWSYNKSIITYA